MKTYFLLGSCLIQVAIINNIFPKLGQKSDIGLMTEHSELGTLRKRGMIACEIIKDGVSEQNKTIKKLTRNLSQYRNISSEDPQHA